MKKKAMKLYGTVVAKNFKMYVYIKNVGKNDELVKNCNMQM